jgi:cyclophilin family peptidyl-prolyl cis-trans isomerase
MQKTKGTQSGNVAVIVLIIILFLGGAWYLVSKKYEEETQPPEASKTIGTEKASTSVAAVAVDPVPSADPIITEPKTANKKNMNTITLDTNHGKIIFQTYNDDAPKTVENFLTLAKKGFYDNLIFHRVIKGFMIQGGDPTGTGMGGPGYKFADELNANTLSYKEGYKKGVVAMANAGPNTNGSQFFIMLENYPLPNNYTIFGKVISGQEVVDEIGNVKTGSNDKPAESVVMKKVTVSE